MSTGLRGAFGAAASASGTVATASLPAGIQAGDEAYVAFSINGGTSVTITSPPSGWSLEAGPINLGNVNQTYLYKKTLTGSETTVSATWSQTGRWTVGGAVISGAALGPDSRTVITETTSDTTCGLPNYTPAVSSCYAVGIVSGQQGTGALSMTTPPAGWTNIGEYQTSVSGLHKDMVILGKQLGAGTGGNSQTGGNGVWSAAATQVGWIITVAPGFATITGTAAGAQGGSSSAVATVRHPGTVADAGAGSSAATGQVTHQGTAAAVQAGSSSATGARTVYGTASMAQAGASSATGDQSTPSGSIDGTAAAIGGGSSSAMGTVVKVGTAAVAGGGVAAAAGLVKVTGTAAATGSGTSGVTAVRTVYATAGLAGAGASAATGATNPPRPHVPADPSRTRYVAAERRVIEIEAETRTRKVRAEVRTITA